MRLGKKSTRISISVLLIMLMMINAIPAFASSRTNMEKVETITAKEKLKDTAEKKIKVEVQEQFKDEEYVGVLVYLKDQVDVENLAKFNLNSMRNLTPNQAKLESRDILIEALKDTAENTQMSLLKYLEQEKTKGNVLEYESYYIVNMVYINATKEVVENISYMDEVEKIYLNRTIEIEEPIINKNKLNSKSLDDELEWNIEKVGADLVWDMGIDGTGITVGIIDSGVDWTHPALKQKWRGYNPENPNNPINPEENWFDPVNGSQLPNDEKKVPHGTHCLGTTLGQEEDGTNKIGVAPGANWIAAKAFTEQGGRDNWLLSAGQWMLAPGGDPQKAPDVINNSWGGLDGVDDWYRWVVEAWRAAGIVPIFAAGNQRTGEPAPWPGSIANPANLPESFAVGAIDINNKRGSFSKLGPSPYDESLIKPEISAPGVNIRSSVPGGYEDGWDGTSMAAPHVTGTVALMLQANSSLTVEQIENILVETATPLTDDVYQKSPNYGYGYGLLNTHAAVSEASIGTGIISGKVLVSGEDTEDPTITHNQEILKSYLDTDIEIKANVKDDVSVVAVELLAKTENTDDWNVIPMERISGDYKDGVYIGTISNSVLEEGTLSYRIRSVDHGGKVSFTDEYNIEIEFGIVPGEYEMDFESFPAGWELEGEWEWGEPTIGLEPHSGEKLVGTVLDGEYSSTDSILITPPIDLRDTGLEGTILRYYQWYETENYFDGCYVYISRDNGENWDLLKGKLSGDGKEWEEIVINLKEYIGNEEPVYIAFLLQPDTMFTSNKLGWYIDDFGIYEKDEIAPSKPTNVVAEGSIEGVRLSWSPSPEGDVEEYNIYRTEIKDGEYLKIDSTSNLTYIDTKVESGKTYYYAITATDFSGNESEYSDKVLVTLPKVETIYYSNFEDNDGGFTTGGENNPWEHGIPTSGPESAYTGTKVWATNLAGSYSSNSNGWIKSPKITLPDEGEIILNVCNWASMEEYGADYGYIEISEDGENWINITPNGKIKGFVEYWNNTEIDLNEYMGKDIYLRLLFVSDAGLNYDGWYIDSIGVYNMKDSDISQDDIIAEEASDTKEMKTLEYKLNRDEKTNYNTISNDLLNAEIKESSLPATAIVTIMETGRSVKTDPATGNFSIRHAINKEGEDWTLRAEAYGHYPKEIKVHLEKGQEVNETIPLDPIPMGTIEGKVIDRYSKEPVEGAIIRVKEDHRTPYAITDKDGKFIIPAIYEGNYTLKIMSVDFEPEEAEIKVVADNENNIEIEVKRFVGNNEEIFYDDGTAEDAVVMNGAGNGTAVRFTPERYGKVKGANIYFFGETFPEPGGNEIKIGLFDIQEGKSTTMMGQPKPVTIERGKWNYIDLLEYNFATDRDFIIATIQGKEGSQSPATGIDKDSTEPERSYVYASGEFRHLADVDIDGGFMIRSSVIYSLGVPEISNLKQINYVNNDTIVLEGKTQADCKVKIYVNDDEPIIVDTNELKFATEINLTKEENIVYVSALIDGKETEPTEKMIVIKDMDLPELYVEEPLDNQIIDKEVIHIIGNARDKYLSKVTINGEEIILDSGGSFHHRLLANEGKNIVEIIATDLAGNETIIKRNVIVKLGASVISAMEPNRDMVYKAGENLKVSFKAEPNGQGYFRVLGSITTASDRDMGIPMIESEEVPGLYEGVWIIPEGFATNNALIEFEFIDGMNNKTISIAPGRISIEDMLLIEDLPSNTVIIGNEAFDIRYLNNNEEAQLKLINWYGMGKEIYIKLNQDTIVNIRGEIIDKDLLPDEIKYYDENGRMLEYKN